jgi:UPF0716 family protein affecting phage T7 exclusion
MGLLFLGLLGSSFAEALRLRLQPAIPFLVTETEIVPADSGRSGFNLVIRFREEGRNDLERAELHKADYRDLVVVQRRLPHGSTVIGRRLPADHPARLDLVEPGFTTLFALPLLLLPLAFVAAGAWAIWSSWTGRSQTAPSRRDLSPGVTLCAGILFATPGTLAVAFALILPLVRHMRSADWIPTPAVIEMSRSVSARSSKGGRSWHPEVLYQYASAGVVRRASRIRFGDGWTRSETKTFLQSHPVGAKVSCLVDPADPDHAVLERRFSPLQWIFLVFLAFPLAGAYMIRKGWRKLRQRRWTGAAKCPPGRFGLRRL